MTTRVLAIALGASLVACPAKDWVCPAGFVKWESDCVDVNECREEPNRCGPDETSTCINQDGGFSCGCRPGFDRHDGRCVDIDECLAPEACEGGRSICFNTAGSFGCAYEDEARMWVRAPSSEERAAGISTHRFAIPSVTIAPDGVEVDSTEVDTVRVRAFAVRGIARARDCYLERLRAIPGAAGVVTLRADLTPSGQPGAFTVDSNTTGLDELGECASRVVEGAARERWGAFAGPQPVAILVTFALTPVATRRGAK